MRHPEMMDERIHDLMRKAVEIGLTAEEAAEVTLEIWRARGVEKKQAEHLRQKDEQIEALAAVLEAHNNRLTTQYASEPGCHEIILSNYERQKMREALRLAGRTP